MSKSGSVQHAYTTRLFSHSLGVQAARTGVMGRDLYRALPPDVQSAYSLADFFRFAAIPSKGVTQLVPDDLADATFGVYVRMPGLLTPVKPEEVLDLRPFNNQEIFFVGLMTAKRQIQESGQHLTGRRLVRLIEAVGEDLGSDIADVYVSGRRISGNQGVNLKRRDVRAVLTRLNLQNEPG